MNAFNKRTARRIGAVSLLLAKGMSRVEPRTNHSVRAPMPRPMAPRS